MYIQFQCQDICLHLITNRALLYIMVPQLRGKYELPYYIMGIRPSKYRSMFEQLEVAWPGC